MYETTNNYLQLIYSNSGVTRWFRTPLGTRASFSGPWSLRR